jgi:hypothetical protein
LNAEQTVTVRVDETITGIWGRLSIFPEEQASRLEGLNARLQEVDQQFVMDQYSELYQIRQSISAAKALFADTKDSYGDLKIQVPDVASLPLKQRLSAFQSATSAITEEHRDRVEVIRKTFRVISRLFDGLGYAADDRSEFAANGEKDMTLAKQKRLQQ